MELQPVAHGQLRREARAWGPRQVAKRDEAYSDSPFMRRISS